MERSLEIGEFVKVRRSAYWWKRKYGDILGRITKDKGAYAYGRYEVYFSNGCIEEMPRRALSPIRNHRVSDEQSFPFLVKQMEK